jgi:hypothetical protein
VAAGPSDGQDVVIDACCLINFSAVDAKLAFLGDFSVSWRLPVAAQGETMYIGLRADSTERVLVDLDPVIAAGVIQTCFPAAGPEMDLYVQLAADLDDGEAMALAIASHRGWTLATDDRKARRKAEELSVQTTTTPQLMRRWSERTRQPRREIADALRRIETLARFVPGSAAPDARWWQDQLKD